MLVLLRWATWSAPAELLGRGRVLVDGVDIRIIQPMLGHSDIKTTQRYLNITDEEFRKTLTGVWNAAGS